jgi:2-iminobutanoate/2-iminopropanoate deaminase
MDPKTLDLAEGVEAQTTQALKNLSALVEASGGQLSQVVRVACPPARR